MHHEFKHDEIGYWTEIKHKIIKKYAKAYSTIMSTQKVHFHYFYIDAFAGSGEHISKSTGGFVPGSPLNALNVSPPFNEYHFIELNPQKVGYLENLVGSRKDVKIYQGDCNKKLSEQILPLVKWEERKRALCVLDPYGLDLEWKVVSEIAKMKTIEIFLNFPLLDMNRNVLWHNPEAVPPDQIERMDRYWGDRSWRDVAYAKKRQTNLFKESEEEKLPSIVVVKAFQERLIKKALFPYVPDPIPMKNNNGGIIYYLFFASHNKTGARIAQDIFKSHKNRSGF